MKILVFIDSFEGGGMARLLSSIVNGLISRKHVLIVASNLTRPINYTLDDRITKINWYPENYYNTNKFFRLINLIKEGRRIIKDNRPDVIISACPHTIFLSRISGIGLGIPFVFADNTSYARKDNCFIHYIRYHFYKYAKKVTIQTENDRKILGKRLPNKVVISNPLSYPIFKGKSVRNKTLLAIGHTDRWEIKGFDILFRVWGKIAPSHPEWKVQIIGGESQSSKQVLANMLKENKIENSVEFLGFRTDTDLIMQQSSIFVLPSRIEGFSISLTEALSQGLPAVAFKIHGVITDVSGNGHGTLLVDDGNETDFKNSLLRLMENNDLWEQLSADGKKYVERYDLCNIINKWENLLNEVVNK